MKKDFIWDYNDEPHASRRKLIIKKYPEIKNLYGHDPNFKYVVGLLLTIQLTTAYFIQFTNYWTVFVLCAYFIGGTSNHMLMLAMHELAHNLGFRKISHNKLFGIVANLPVGVPSAMYVDVVFEVAYSNENRSFKRYHMEHHRYQGEDGIDVDIPTVAEGNYIDSTFKKFLFVCFQVCFYAFRPLIVNPKSPGLWEGLNFVACIAFDVLVYIYMSPMSLGYLLLGTLMGSGLHPVAGHFIAEHYVFVKGAETYSYYGLLNFFAFNVGYHNEHHDFPYIPGSRLPQVRAIASEFYDHLPQCDSWVMVIYNYITDPEINAFSRVKRSRLSAEETKRVKAQ